MKTLKECIEEFLNETETNHPTQTNQHGASLVRAELRRLNLPEHGPNWKELDHDHQR